MDTTTVKDDAASPRTAVENGTGAGAGADGAPESRLSAPLLEALDAIQPKAAANGPDQGRGAGGAFDALCSGADEQITNVLKSWHQSYQNGEGNKSPCFYLLSNKPSGGRLFLSKLRGRARAVAERVAGICEKGQEFDVFMATLEKKTVSPPGDFSREDCERWLEKEYEDDEDISEEEINRQAGPEGHPDTGAVAEVKWSLKTIFDMSGEYAATDIPAQESY
ncbi:hypothetical protein BJ166DRAFT_531639 [Pestalotiopsis sp. NC0098]|nr:hypothetical protein BJ166DRAFT_531639 [Pestalotiopsis sp. NC0098]